MTIQAHEVSIVAQGKRVPGWKSYSITQDVLQPANSFSVDVRFTREAWELLERDVLVQIFLDRTRIMSGFIGRREKVSSISEGTILRVSGRDKTGRLVDESAPLLRYGGLRIKELAEKLAGDLFEDGVVLVNTENRRILRNVRARQAKVIREPLANTIGDINATTLPGSQTTARQISRQVAAGEALDAKFQDSFRALSGLPMPAVLDFPDDPLRVTRVIRRPPIVEPGIFEGRQAPKKVPPGASRWQVLTEILAEARLMAWSSADGRTLFVGLPAYEQPIQYRFFEPGQVTGQSALGNAKISVIQDVEEMYSAYLAVGAAKGNGSNYGPNVVKNRAVVYDNPENPGIGTGINFRRRKFLMVSDDGIKNQRDALERAEREKLEREANFWEVVVDVAGHSQLYSGEEPTLYAVDTMARVYDGDTGIGLLPGLPKDWYITQVNFSTQPNSPTRTQLRMVPKDTLLVS